MKTYNEMAKRVFERIEEYEAARKIRKKQIGRLAVCACCLVLVAAIGAIPMLQPAIPNGSTNAEGGEPAYNGAIIPEYEDKDGDWSADGDYDITNFPEIDPDGNETSFAANDKPFIGHAPNQPFGGEYSDMEYLTFIEEYPMPGDETPCYKLPADGEWFLTVPLKGAIGEYGGDVVYRVLVRIFDNGKLLSDPQTLKAEFTRLGKLGYTSVFERFEDGSLVTYQLSLHATEEQLLNFVPNEDYGYVILLYAEETHPEQGW